MLIEVAWNRIGIVAVQVQGDRGIGVRRALQHRSDQAWLEVAEELQRAQCRFAAAAHFGGLVVAEEQPLVFAQRVLDLAVARQRGVVMDAEPLRGLELGLVIVADPALCHQPGGFEGQVLATLAGTSLRMRMRVGLGVLAAVLIGASHRRTPVRPAATVPDCDDTRIRAACSADPGRIIRKCRTLPRPVARPAPAQCRVRSACVPRLPPSAIRPRRWP